MSESHRPLHKRDVKTVVIRVRQRRVLTDVGVTQVWATSVVIPCRQAGGHVLIHADDQMKSPQALNADAQCAAPPYLLFDFQAHLLREGISHVAIHRGEIHERDRWDHAAQYVGKRRRNSLCWGEAHTNLAELIEIGSVARRQNRIRERAKRDSVIEQSSAAAYDSSPRFKR